MNLSFAGCGFLGIYHVGVASCFSEYAPHIIEGNKVAGTSAGAVCAACLICDVSLGECTSYVLRIASKARSRTLGPFHPSFHVLQILRQGLDEILPPNAHLICSGRLHVSMTRVSDRENVIISQFETREHLLQALMCTAFVPFYCGLIPPSYEGVRYVDGGLSDNLPILNDETVTVSPFAGECDICPNDNSPFNFHMNLANTSLQFTARNLYRMSHVLFPPHPEILSAMCRQGFDDALRFLQRNKLISCVKHLSIVSCLRPQEAGFYPSDEEDVIVVDESDDDTDCDTNNCYECKHRQRKALGDTLPVTVLEVLQASCSKHGILAQLYDTRLYRITSLALTPWILPIDCAYNFTLRFLKWLPALPDDGSWILSELKKVIKSIIHYLGHEHHLNARFMCEFNITETDCPDALHHNKHRNVNVGFAVKFHSSRNLSSSLRDISGSRANLSIKENQPSPVDCIHQIEKKMIEEHRHGHQITAYGSMQDVSHAEQQPLVPGTRESKKICHHRHHAPKLAGDEFETVEKYFEETQDMDTVMAYYYVDEDENLVKVTEICAPHMSKTSSVSMEASAVSLSDSGWSLIGSDYTRRRSEGIKLSQDMVTDHYLKIAEIFPLHETVSDPDLGSPKHSNNLMVRDTGVNESEFQLHMRRHSASCTSKYTFLETTRERFLSGDNSHQRNTKTYESDLFSLSKNKSKNVLFETSGDNTLVVTVQGQSDIDNITTDSGCDHQSYNTDQDVLGHTGTQDVLGHTGTQVKVDENFSTNVKRNFQDAGNGSSLILKDEAECEDVDLNGSFYTTVSTGSTVVINLNTESDTEFSDDTVNWDISHPDVI